MWRRKTDRTDIARVIYVAYMAHIGIPIYNEIPPPDTFPWKLADAVVEYLKTPV